MFSAAVVPSKNSSEQQQYAAETELGKQIPVNVITKFLCSVQLAKE